MTRVILSLTTVHPLNVHFKLLRLTELPATKVAERSGTLWIRTASIRPVHLQVVQSQKVLLAELTLVSALSLVHLCRMLHDVVLAQHSHSTDLAVVLADRQTEGGVVEYRAVRAIVQRVLELEITSTAICK